MTLEYDPLSPRWRDDPYPVYRELRDRAPVHFSPEAGMHCISRNYAVCDSIFLSSIKKLLMAATQVQQPEIPT